MGWGCQGWGWDWGEEGDCSVILITSRKFGLPYLGMATEAVRVALPIPNSVCNASVCQTMVWLPPVGIFTMSTDADACDCAWRMRKRCKRVCTESWVWERKKLVALGNWTQVNTAPDILVWHSTNWAIPPLSTMGIAFIVFLLPKWFVQKKNWSKLNQSFISKPQHSKSAALANHKTKLSKQFMTPKDNT